MTPADCAAAPLELIDAVNPADVHAIDALVLPRSVVDARATEKADAIADRSPPTPFPATKHPELRAAIKLARVAREVMAEAYVESDLRRQAYYKLRDSDEMKEERRRAKNAVPFPAGLVVPRKPDSKPFLDRLIQQFSDGTTKVSEADYPGDPPNHVRLDYQDAAARYYADDLKGAEKASGLIQGYRRAQHLAEDDLPTLRAAYDYLMAYRPMVQAAKKQRQEALEAIEAVRPTDLQTALEKARALAGLDYSKISDKGVCYNSDGREDYDSFDVSQAVLMTLWVDLNSLVAGEEDAELVALGAKHAELDEQSLKLVDEHRGTADDAHIAATAEVDRDMRQIVDRSLALRATSFQGLRAKALIADAHQPPEGTYEYDELPWTVARSLITDALNAA